MTDSNVHTNVPVGVLIARWAGVGAAILMAALVAFRFATGSVEGFFDQVYSIYQILFAAIVCLPLYLVHDKFKLWLPAFILLIISTVLFVFFTVAHVIFAYIEAAEAGERLRLPGFRGTLIFIFLMQIPVVLFHRKPDALD